METTTDFYTRDQILEIFKAMGSKVGGGAAQQNLIKRPQGQLVWIKNTDFNEAGEDNREKPFYKANIVTDEGMKATLKLAQGEECQEPKFLQPFDREQGLIMDYSEMAEKGIRDMIDIDELNHATILYNLYKRYENDDIYTYVGPTLLAVNPFKNMSQKYPPSIINDYHKITEASESEFLSIMRAMPPHSYAISAFSHK